MSGLRRALAAAVLTVSLLASCASHRPGRAIDDESLIQTARDFVALIGGYNCQLLPNYLPAGAAQYFGANITPVLLNGMADPVERVCFVLGVIQRYPRSETMEVRARNLTASAADLILLGDDEEAELRFVREGEPWKLDPRWALSQVQDLAVEQSLRTFAIREDEFYSHGDNRFSDDPQEIAGRTHVGIEFSTGIARGGVPPMVVYGALGPGAQSVCGSSASLSGELFMIRQAADGSTSYARGSSLPAACPADRLDVSW